VSKHGVTFEELVILEPRLQDVLDQARSLHRPRMNYRKLLDIWYRTLKPQITSLVGDLRKPHPVLGTHDAYDAAYDTCLAALKGEKPRVDYAIRDTDEAAVIAAIRDSRR
jgi:hypothetical protein